LEVKILAKRPNIGDFAGGHVVTEVRGKKIFGVKGKDSVPQEMLDELRSGKAFFRPGYHFAVLTMWHGSK
jgi:hypothetical protein